MTVLNKKLISLAIKNNLGIFAIKKYMKYIILFFLSLSGAISHFADCYN